MLAYGKQLLGYAEQSAPDVATSPRNMFATAGRIMQAFPIVRCARSKKCQTRVWRRILHKEKAARRWLSMKLES